jgi:hypothetical protein
MTEPIPDIEEVDAPSMTITEWCRAERQSRSTFQRLQHMGLGPHTMKLPGTRIVRIVESRSAYHKRMLGLSESRKAKREQRRRSEAAAQLVNKRWAKRQKRA